MQASQHFEQNVSQMPQTAQKKIPAAHKPCLAAGISISLVKPLLSQRITSAFHFIFYFTATFTALPLTVTTYMPAGTTAQN